MGVGSYAVHSKKKKKGELNGVGASCSERGRACYECEGAANLTLMEAG